jgi:hypothetical protein
VAFDAGVERGRVEMGREVREVISEQPPVQWLDEVARYCANSMRCQDALEYFTLFSGGGWALAEGGTGYSVARWVGHDEDRAAALVLWTRASRAACHTMGNNDNVSAVRCRSLGPPVRRRTSAPAA